MNDDNKILIVSEDKITRALILKILTTRGYQPDNLKGIYNIYKMLDSADYKLLIIDVTSLKNDPSVLLEKIKKLYHSVLIITLSDPRLINLYSSDLNLMTDKLILSPLDPKLLLDATVELLGADSRLNRKAGLLDKKMSQSDDSRPAFLRSLDREEPEKSVKSYERKVIAIGGGKGGVGKSIVTANLAAGLAKEGKQVIAVDIDTGGPNLHTCLGIKKLQHGLFDFLLRKEKKLAEIACSTDIKGLKVIGIKEDYPGDVNIKFNQKIRLVEALKELDADYILLDLGSGATSNVVDFFAIADEGIIVSSTEVTSILNTYSFIKSLLYRKMEKYLSDREQVELLEIVRKSADPENEMGIKQINDLEEKLIKVDPAAKEMIAFLKKQIKVKLVLNMVKKSAEEKIGLSIKDIVKKFLSIDVEYLGPLKRDDVVETSVKGMRPFVLAAPSSLASLCLKSILSKIMSAKKNSEKEKSHSEVSAILLRTTKENRFHSFNGELKKQYVSN